MAVEALKKTSLLGTLEDSLLYEIDLISTEQPIQPGKKLIEAGQVNDSLWVLLSGALVVRDLLPGGLEMDLFRLREGDLFGEVSFVDALPASASVVAESQGKVLRIPFADFRVFLSKNPQAHIRFLEQLATIFSQRLRSANRQIGKGFLASLGMVDG